MMVQDALRSALAVIGRHAGAVSEIFVARSGVAEGEDEAVLKALRSAQLLWHPASDEPPRLVPELSALCERVTRDPRRRLVDPNIGATFENLRSAVDDYKMAKRKHETEAAAMYLQQAESMVVNLARDLSGAALLLWEKVQSRFGYMTSLEMKIKENDAVLSQARRLNNQLEQISPADLEELAGHDPALRRLLLGWLYGAVEDCRRQLNDALHRIGDLLFEFRKKGRLTRLVAAFAQRYQADPTYQPANYCDSVSVPHAFNQAAPMPVVGHANLFSDEETLAELISGLRKTPPPPAEEVVVVPVLASAPPPPEKLEKPALLVAVDDFIMDACRSGTWLSAVEHAPSREVSDLPTWVWVLMSRLDSLQGSAIGISVDYDDWTHPVFRGVRFIRDIRVARSGTDPSLLPQMEAGQLAEQPGWAG